jgi:hypothetical protein
LSERPFTPLTPFAVTTEHVYFLAEESPITSRARLLRSDRVGGAPEVLAQNLPQFSGLAVVAGEVFLWGDGENLWSGTDANHLRDHGFPATSVTEHEGIVYAARQGTVVSRAPGEDSWTARRWLADGHEGTECWLAAASPSFGMLCFTTDDTPDHYEFYSIDRPAAEDPGAVLVASGLGRPTRMRTARNFIYWLVEDESRRSELWRLETPTAEVRLLAAEHEVSDFAVDAAFVYLTRTVVDDSGYQIVLIAADDITELLRFGTELDMRFPEVIDEQLWFFADERLRRVDLEIGGLRLPPVTGQAGP